MAEGIKACGDNPIIVNENLTGQWIKDEMEPTAPIGCMFGYGGSNQKHHTKGRRRDLVERAKKKGIYIITFDGGVLSSFGNVHGPNHHWRVALYSPMNNGNFLSDNSKLNTNHGKNLILMTQYYLYYNHKTTGQ